MLVRQGKSYGIIEVNPDQKMEKTLALNEMEMTVDPRKEWEQIFNDAWRFQRDFFYDKGMHGVDWDAMKEAIWLFDPVRHEPKRCEFYTW